MPKAFVDEVVFEAARWARKKVKTAGKRATREKTSTTTAEPQNKQTGQQAQAAKQHKFFEQEAAEAALPENTKLLENACHLDVCIRIQLFAVFAYIV